MLTPSPRFGAPPMTLVSHPSRETRPLLTHIVMRYIVYLLPCTLYRGAIYMHVAAATICPHDPSISGELGVAGQAAGREEIHARSGLGVDRAGMSRPLKLVRAESERSPQHGTSGVLFRVFRFDPRVTRFGACGSMLLCRQQTISYYDTSNGTEAEDAVSPFAQWLSLESKSGTYTSASLLR